MFLYRFAKYLWNDSFLSSLDTMTVRSRIILSVVAAVFTVVATVVYSVGAYEQTKPRPFLRLTPAHNDSVGDRDFSEIVISVAPGTDFESLKIDYESAVREGWRPLLTNGNDTVEVTVGVTRSMTARELRPERNLTPGTWRLEVPAGYFYMDYRMDEVESVSGNSEYYSYFPETGAWHKAGAGEKFSPMFTIHDDDTIDGTIPSSNPSSWMAGGYFSLLYPVLESLGLRGCLSMEGWRAGFTDDPPALNSNGLTARRLQDEKGWEIQSHSMTARYYNNTYYVDSLQSELADRILREGVYNGIRSNTTTSVYDASSGVQYSVNSTLSGWEPTPREWIKAYLIDYVSGRVKMYNPAFPVDYQWGEWFAIADTLGIHAKAWVTPGPTSSHANVPLINRICPCGFETDGKTFYNLPPLGSTITRMMLDGQQFDSYTGEEDTDNLYHEYQYDFYRSQIDEAAERGGWIVLGLHAYRPCWRNSTPGALVSEGGVYPDSWVWPMSETDPETGDLRPAESLGISDWSQWYPCPGTRLYMLWELLRYARDKGMLNVTSGEGFDRMGNKVTAGYYEKGAPIGPDAGAGIIGTRANYPHYVAGINGEQEYFNPRVSPEIMATYEVVEGLYRVIGQLKPGESLQVVTAEGRPVNATSMSHLEPGLYVINGRKVLIR